MAEKLPIAVDAMGGDYGPRVVVEGAVDALKEWGIRSIIVGDQEEIASILSSLGADSLDGIEVRHADEVVEMGESPSRAVRNKPNSSIRVSFDLVGEGIASAVVSPGNTGAMMAAGMLVAGTLPGIARPAIATLIPKSGDHPPTVLLDSGANIECHAQQLVQFALMGDCYSKIAISSDSPRVGLLSNGSERSKGTDVIRSAATTLKSLSELNFIGFVEGRDIPRDVADVVVCDGFVGNIVLKSMEGSVELVLDLVKNHVVKTLRGKIGMWLAAPKLKSLFKQRLDPSAYGGAPLLGLREVAIVCHGSSKKRAIKNAVRVARQLVDRELVKEMGQALGSLDSEMEGEYENGMWNRLGTKLEKDSKQKKVPASKAAGQSED